MYFRRGLVTDSNEAVDHLNMIHSSGAHLLELINDILDLSKIEAGRMQVESIDTHVDQVILDVVNVLDVRAKEKEIDLVTDFPTSLPKVIQADPTRLRQIITNLVGNAIKFTSEGCVTVGATLSDGKSPELRVDVTDSGIGMTEEQQSKIFESFVQADTTTTRKFGGTGLGLSISRRLATAMGGQLTVSSKPGVGSTFSVTLPLTSSDLTDMMTSEEISKLAQDRSNNQQGDGLASLPNKPVLVVDDGEANRRLLELVLTRAGAEVVTAKNGQEAIDAINAREFSMVYMDMQMPILDGYEATARIRDTGNDVPIVALTGNAMKGDRERCLKIGCNEFLSKPVNLDALLECSIRFLGAGPVAVKQQSANGHVLGALDSPQTSDNETADTGPIHSTLPMDDEDFRGVVSDFIDRLDARLDFIEQACQSADFDSVQNQAHWLKGSGGTVGFAEFSSPAEALEQAARDQDQHQAIELMQTIQDIRSRLVQPQVNESLPSASGLVLDMEPAEKLTSTMDSSDPIHSTLPMDDEDFRTIVVDFVERLDPRLEEMRVMLEQARWEELGNEAHWLKGSGGTVGYGEFMIPAMHLMMAARTESQGDCKIHFAEVMAVRQRLVVPTINA